MSDDFDAIVGDIDDELDLTLYADAAELSEEVTVQILAYRKGPQVKEPISLSPYWWHLGCADFRSFGQ
jgi:6-phosphogluconolactonase